MRFRWPSKRATTSGPPAMPSFRVMPPGSGIGIMPRSRPRRDSQAQAHDIDLADLLEGVAQELGDGGHVIGPGEDADAVA